MTERHIKTEDVGSVHCSDQAIRNTPLKHIRTKIRPFQIGQVAQFRRYLSAQLVIVESQPLQIGEATQSGVISHSTCKIDTGFQMG